MNLKKEVYHKRELICVEEELMMMERETGCKINYKAVIRVMNMYGLPAEIRRRKK